MMRFEIYKIIHIASVFVFLTATSVTFFLDSDSKGILVGFKIASGLFGFTVFFTGLGLLLSLSNGFPLWAIFKGFIWLALMAFGGIVAKRFTRLRVPAYCFLMILATAAVYLAVAKP